MGTQLTCHYKCKVLGPLTPAAILQLIEDVPLDTVLPASLGLRFISDNTTETGGIATREIVYSMEPASDGTITATVRPGGEGKSGPIISYAVTAAGSDYALAPILVISDASSIDGVSGKGAIAIALLQPVSVAIASAGIGYAATSVVKIGTDGGLYPGSTPAILTPSFNGGGSVTGVAVSGNVTGTLGQGTCTGGYYAPPTLTLVDPTGAGAGAVLRAVMGINAVILLYPGTDYVSPTVTVTPIFKYMYPDDPISFTQPNQSAALGSWMRVKIQQGADLTVTAPTPVVS